MSNIDPSLLFRRSPVRTVGRLSHAQCNLILLLALLLALCCCSVVAASQETPNESPERTDTGARTGATGQSKVPAKYDVTQIGARNIGKGINLYSLEREYAMGKQLAAQVETQVQLNKDSQITEYVNGIVQNLVRHSDAHVAFTVKVINDDEVNAFALPGGFLFVNTGLIEAADSEAALAGVLAHEIAHVAARHATKNATRSQLFNLASIPLIFFGGPAIVALQQAASIALPMSMLKFSRDSEREADLLGMEYEYATGYDPAEFVQFFEKLRIENKQKPLFIAKMFSTHPMTTDRIKRAQSEIASMLPAKSDYVITTSAFDEIKMRVSKLTNPASSDKPVLRRRVESNSDESGNDRPTLHRK